MRATTLGVKKNGRRAKRSEVTNAQNESSISLPELHKKIEQKAYELFEKRGCQHGNDIADWFTAEKLVKQSK